LSGIARALLAGNTTAGRDPRLHPRYRGHARLVVGAVGLSAGRGVGQCEVA